MNFEKRHDELLKLGVSSEKLRLLDSYINRIWSANQDLNLISRQMSLDDLVDNHLMDCLLPLAYFNSKAKRVADLGSGSGLPGVLYALLFPQIEFHLYEKSPKKQEFLKSCMDLAPNIEVHGLIPPELPSINLVMARAFKPIDVLLELTRSYFLRGGPYFLFKARRAKIDEEVHESQKKFSTLPQNLQIQPLHSSVLDVERHLVLIN